MSTAAIAKTPEILAPNGSSARLEGSALVVRNDAGDVVAVYDEATRSTRIVAPDGDLVLCAPKGKVIVESPIAVEVRTSRWELRADRVRALVRDAYRLFAGRTSIVSQEDTSIDGKRILLG